MDTLDDLKLDREHLAHLLDECHEGRHPATQENEADLQRELDELDAVISTMGLATLILAQDDKEHPVPEQLRPRFKALVAAFVAGDYRLSRHPLEGIAPIDGDTAQVIEGQIAAYGATLVPLNDEVWQRSIYLWMDDYWEFLIDLSTTRDSASDLALHAKLFGGPSGRIEVSSVHVP